MKATSDRDCRPGRMELRRLRRLPRYAATTTRLFGKKIHLVDAPTFLAGNEEIFGRRVYEFAVSRPDPFIIDCGANIGLSVIFFKRLYPDARVVAFEPDPTIFRALEANVAAFQLFNVELHNQAVWCAETDIEFQIEGGHSGRVARPGDGHVVWVPSIRLKELLIQKVDFLKVDIEGAETAVIADCADELAHVEYLFVEYHSHSEEPQTLQRILSIVADAGFRYHIKEEFASPQPFKERRLLLGMDLQLNLFCYRKETP